MKISFLNKRALLSGLSILLFVILLPEVSLSETFYVNNSGSPACSDTYNGTAAQPWCTVQKAASTLQAGDTVYVENGVYDELVAINIRSGASGSPITFVSKNKWGADVRQGFYTNKTHIIIDGFKVSEPYHVTEGRHAVQILSGARNVDVKNLWIQDAHGCAIYTEAPYTNIIGNYIYRSECGIYVRSANNSNILNNEVERLYRYSGMYDSDYVKFFGDSITFSGNYFHGTTKQEIGGAHVDCFQYFDDADITATNILIENNQCTSFHQALMLESDKNFYNTSITVRNNVFDGKAFDKYVWGWCIKAIKNLKLYNNVFANTTHNSGDLNSTIIHRNNIYYNGGNMPYGATSGVVQTDHNLLYKSGYYYNNWDYPYDVVNKDPKFVNPATSNYAIRVDSPARNAGTALEGFTSDIRGMPRPPNAAWDIGAYQYRATNLGSPQNFRKMME
jgi:parallel beta-helix repeat protein